VTTADTSSAEMPRRVAWFQCGAGVAGDMTLAALVDAGADPDQIAAAIAGLGVSDYALFFERVQRCGVRSTWTNLVIHAHDEHGDDHEHDDHEHGQTHEHGHDHRPASAVLELIAAADLTPRIRERALAAYRLLAEVEGEIHGIAWEDVELHEVGALDSIIDVVGVCAALESLGIDEVHCSPIAVGHGTVRTAHGQLPNPVPAVSHLLARAGAPSVGLDTTMELSTPTGVALMTSLVAGNTQGSTPGGFRAMPAMRVIATGYGAGTADPPGRPNVVQVVIGEPAPTASISVGSQRGEQIIQVEANLDDVSGEILAHTITRLLAAGAVDAWAVPIVMKKGRPAHTICALCSESALATVAQVMIAETGTLGLRAQRMERWPQPRSETSVMLEGHEIRIKHSNGRIKVENDDAVIAATALGLSLREVLKRAEALALHQ
jgi:pyridinium-3,5-bisthiocarboxylic acid mononucleotide nickel chelatase